MFCIFFFCLVVLVVVVLFSFGVFFVFVDNVFVVSVIVVVQCQVVVKGLYELVYSLKQNVVFVVFFGGFGEDVGLVQVLCLNLVMLVVEICILLECKVFGVVLDDVYNCLYVGNIVDLLVIVVDIVQNKVVGIIQLMEKKVGKDGKVVYIYDLCELVVDSVVNCLYVIGYSSQLDVSSVLFVIDMSMLKVINIIDGLGNVKVLGLVLDVVNKCVYISNLLVELVVVGIDLNKVVVQYKIVVEQLMNIVLDLVGKCLFVIDQGLEFLCGYQVKSSGLVSKYLGQCVLVFDRGIGKELVSILIDVGLLGILLDVLCKCLYVINCEVGIVIVYNSDSYQKVVIYMVLIYLNSLVLDVKNNVLFVSIKNGEKDDKGVDESVVCIQL